MISQELLAISQIEMCNKCVTVRIDAPAYGINCHAPAFIVSRKGVFMRMRDCDIHAHKQRYL